MNEELERWYKKLWITKGVRFAASKRYELHDKWSTITISLVSIYIICINLLVFFPNRPSYLSNDNITFSTISLSILVIVISIIVNNMNYKHLSHRFHDCGREITILYDHICLLRNNPENVQQDDIKEIINKYHGIIKTYDINHKNLDYHFFIKDYPEEFKIKYPHLNNLKVKTTYYLDTTGRYLFFLFLPLILYMFFLK